MSTGEEKRGNMIFGIPIDEYISQNAGRTLGEALNAGAFPYKAFSIDELELRFRAYNVLHRYMDPPICRPSGCRFTMDELFLLTVKELYDIPTMKAEWFIEILENADSWLKNCPAEAAALPAGL